MMRGRQLNLFISYGSWFSLGRFVLLWALA